MRAVEILQRPTVEQIGTLTDLVERTAAATGNRPLSDHLWLDLRRGGGDGFVAVVATDESGPIALAQISRANDSSSLEAFVRPDLDDGRVVRDDIAETALDAFASAGGGRVFWWVDDPTDADRSFAESHGLTPVRGLHEMRRSLPLDVRATIETRDFVPGDDDAAWLAVNNRAFLGHGEQGGWTADVLALRMNEPWFDPSGFRLHEIDGRLAGFCWTKLHHELDPVVGEIYVIAVDPDFHGRGLGKQLTLAGLDSIADRDVTEANLYVEADNTAAIGLYEGLGFTIHRSRQAFAGDL
ncbi:mycothiol synthase [Ilumatobacter sp.]|uniref:mycothiol synthase n=1 Tax=Ilumatobacter sp. TaxID=1967498 RepID=UPI003AF592C2